MVLLVVLNVFSDWLHMLGVAAWVGGLLHIGLLLSIVKKESPSVMAGKLGALLLRRFSPIAVISIGVIGVTGIYAVWIEVGSLSGIFSTTYGTILQIKLLLILPIVALGTVNQFGTYNALVEAVAKVPRLKDIQVLLRRFHLTVRTEGALAIIVLLTVGALTSASPAFQASLVQAPQPGSGAAVVRGYSEEGVNVALRISPLQAGINRFEIVLTDVQGKPLSDAQVVTVKFKSLDRDIGETTTTADRKGPELYYL